MDPWVRKGLLDSRSLGHKVRLDHRASLVRRDLRAHKDLRAHRGQRALQDLKERGETLDSQAALVHLDRTGSTGLV